MRKKILLDKKDCEDRLSSYFPLLAIQSTLLDFTNREVKLLTFIDECDRTMLCRIGKVRSRSCVKRAKKSTIDEYITQKLFTTGFSTC